MTALAAGNRRKQHRAMENSFWWIERLKEGPLVATAIHNGHDVSAEILRDLFVDEETRLREEDPYTGLWTRVGHTQVVVHASRFEVDLNRPRQKAVYVEPGDAWGLRVWKTRPSAEIIAGCMAKYDAFYAELSGVLDDLQRRFGHFLVYDLHSYNHMRAGPDMATADPGLNPEVNIGSESVDRTRWAGVVDRFVSDLRAFDFCGRRLDVRENVKFKGGHLSRWINETYSGSGCSIAIEFKKFFMDEWSGEADPEQLETIYKALESSVPGVLKELIKLGDAATA